PLAERAAARRVRSARHRDGERALQGPGEDLEDERLAGHEPGVSEAPHLLDDRQQLLALVRQLVLDPRRRLGVAAADDDAFLLERAQPLRQRARADPAA